LKKVWFALIPVAAVAVAVVMLVASCSAAVSVTPVANKTDFPASEITAPAAHYLTQPPYYPNGTYKTTKIYLELAQPWYGYANSTIAAKVGIKDVDGASVIIINGTVRNDYSAQDILQWSQEGVSECYIGLDAYLYDHQGNLINVIERGNPFRGGYETSLQSGEKAFFNMVFITNASVAYFEIYVSYMNPRPQ
jgi:hypothetical protein